jgi:DNA-directed RNA polymerase subunit M/transcription elongation factor TFIIS
MEDKFCPICGMYMSSQVKETELLYRCIECGYSKKDTTGGLVMETILQKKGSEAHKILVNEFTRSDPTLPHTNTIKCPRPTCASNTSGKPKDVIYIKSDQENMKYLYICDVCGEQWRSG